MYAWEHSQQYCVVTDNSSLIVLTILMKCIKTANHYVVHLKLIKYCMLIITQK